ncbi:MAG TPA: ABC transporter ATP-binding protein [Caldisericia bacterium]|nr:ABC transporter ATP-binding protein [Caldisericia bacterium]
MLEVVNLEVNYGAIKALKNISFKVKSGQIVTLIGANGAGKSTTLRTISGLIKPKDGHIYFKGQEITNYEAHKIVELGISHVPEGRKIFETLTVMENLELAAWTIKDKKIRKERFERVFDIFPRLKERRKQLAGTLSGGEQQMLSVARALTTGGELMLLDEPSMGLAPVLVDEIFQVLCQINLQGITILLVEQNARKALEIANYAYVLEAGTIVLQGEAKELKEDSRVKEAYLGG